MTGVQTCALPISYSHKFRLFQISAVPDGSGGLSCGCRTLKTLNITLLPPEWRVFSVVGRLYGFLPIHYIFGSPPKIQLLSGTRISFLLPLVGMNRTSLFIRNPYYCSAEEVSAANWVE